ncbi:NYN domain-containing protein [Arsenicicoccus cauae]|uniref:NYN domain-containing protein n=1 Tax=Arsenicicoccus cauae TaxID=2663847 RepID=A0A6I3IXG8_9MICO|nr:NYN domain-containing protein [Arsenicicoccus cauae]MTB72981.1 NYN domain-containing protein [Arsenicicoccus cauae]
MRSYCALYVDVGYLLCSSATRVTGTSLRGGVRVDHQALIQRLLAQVEADSGLPLLRVNWYDSGGNVNGAPNTSQLAIGMLPRVKLRLGRLSPAGEQKGVDLRLGLDLVRHARNRIVDVLYLLCGDDDLTEAVEEAQGHGAQVILVGVPDAEGRPHAVARHLQREADGLILVDAAAIDETVHRAPMSEPRTASATVPAAGPATGPASGPATGPVPSPADLASRPRPAIPAGHPAPAAPTARVPPAAFDRPSLVYSSTTGRPSELHGPAPLVATPEQIDEVCRSVISTWSASADEAQQQALFAGRPTIPSEVDRALLMDLSARLGVYEISESDRLTLRHRFWDVAEELVGRPTS